MGVVLVEVSVVPLGTGSPSLSSFVADVERVLTEFPDLKSRLTPMSTIIEGELTEIIRAVTRMHEVPFDNGAQRVATRIHIDDRRDKRISMDSKVKSVQDKLT